jgi:hypothetical protein
MQLAFNKKTCASGSAQKNIRSYKTSALAMLRERIFVRAMPVMLLSLAFALPACVTPKKADDGVISDPRRDGETGVQLSTLFESGSELREDRLVSAYLEEIANTLTHSVPSLRDQPVQVYILKDHGSRWMNYGFPGNRIYLSRAMLRNVRFENELAAAIAFELAHVAKRDLLTRYESLRHPAGLPSRSGIFDFPVEIRLRALDSAMEMMYQAGFDPRGMALLLNDYKETPSISPFEPKVTDQLTENSWRIIALHAPLRNPIVRSDRFLAVYQRMKKL